MKKRTFYCMLCFLLMSIAVAAQDRRTVSGVVSDENGTPLAGVSILLPSNGKPAGITNTGGRFSVSVPISETSLKFTSLGFADTSVSIASQTSISVTLRSVALEAGSDVIVTALGIKRQEKSLTYAVQKVNNKDLTTVQNANVMNSLSGKVAGVNIVQSSSGIGGSVRVTLRGNKSTQNNQPLYVIDGIPMNNSINDAQPGDEWGQSGIGFIGLDGGDGITNIDPQNIESMTVLKGASAAALYGSAAANGVILITTKKGGSGSTKIDVSSSWQFNGRMYKTPLQFKYGQTVLPSDTTGPGSLDNWGSAVNSPNFVDGFFQTGLTSYNSIAISTGTDKSQTYLSYSFADNKGMVPTVSFKRHNINFRQTNKYFDDKLTSDVNVLFINQTAHNRPPSGLYLNPIIGLYMFPRNLDYNHYKNNWETFSALRNTNVQNWWDINYDSTGVGYNGSTTQFDENPYWLLNRNTTDNEQNRVYANVALSYKINDWLNVQARGNIDKSWSQIDLESYATTTRVLTGNNGSYNLSKQENTQYYADVMVSANKQLSQDLGLSAVVGASINDSKVQTDAFGTIYNGDGLRYPNIFTLENILPSALTVNQTGFHEQQQAIFATAQLNWKQFIYLDLTGRNDWNSTLAFTPTDHYFYYSAGLNSVLSDAFKLPEPISYGKVRVSYSQVGNGVPANRSNAAPYTIDNQNGAVIANAGPRPGTYLKPERNTSFEAGTEWRFLKDRIGFDFTFYLNNNYRQYVEIPAATGVDQSGTGNSYATWYVNTGDIRNKGIELSINGTPYTSRNVTWNTTVNFARNINTITKIADPSLDVKNDYIPLTGIGNLMYASYIKQGGSWGDIYGHFLARGNDGSILLNDKGVPFAGTDTTQPVGDASLKYLGNPNPKFTLGWNNSITVKNFTLSFLFDGNFGGKVMSFTQSFLDAYGDSKVTGDARDAGGVKIKATTDPAQAGKITTIDAKDFYNAVGGQSGIGEYYMYSATNIRLRELSLSYTVPLKTKSVKNLTVSVIGNNLFFVTKKAPFDPDVSMSTSNGLQGIDTFGLPTSRSIGASLKIGF